MNNKAEYNRCAFPRLTARLGERELEKWREVDKEEMLKEATIEEKIRIMKKEEEKANKRGAGNRRREQGQPERKRVEQSERKENPVKEIREKNY
jgi:hypothetical protein